MKSNSIITTLLASTMLMATNQIVATDDQNIKAKTTIVIHCTLKETKEYFDSISKEIDNEKVFWDSEKKELKKELYKQMLSIFSYSQQK